MNVRNLFSKGACLLAMAFMLVSCHDDSLDDYMNLVCSHYIDLGSPSTKLNPEGGYASLNISVPEGQESDFKWSVSLNCDGTDSEWIEPMETDCEGNHILTLSYSGNDTQYTRQVIVTITDKLHPTNTRSVTLSQETTGSDNSSKSYLGYGYDATGSYNSAASVKGQPILKLTGGDDDVNANGLVTYSTRHIQNINTICGTTLTELQSNLCTRLNLSAEFLKCGAEGTIQAKFQFDLKKDNSYSMIRLNETAVSQSIDMGTLYALMHDDPKKYFDPNFLNAVDDVCYTNDENKIVEFFETYGTHLITGVDLGGSLTYYLAMERLDTCTTLEVTTKLKAYFLGINYENTDSVHTWKWGKPATEIYNASVTVQGGSEATAATLKAQAQAQQPITPDQLAAWVSSLHDKDGTGFNEDNVEFIDATYIPLYNIIPDMSKRVLLREKMLVYFKKKQYQDSQIEKDRGFDYYKLPNPADAVDDETMIAAYQHEWEGQDEELMCVFNEYVPAVRTDQLVKVAYPIVNGVPYLSDGVFLGDKEHSPGYIRWYTNMATYTPDTCDFKGMLDKDGQLNAVYYYYKKIHIQPCKELTDLSIVDNVITSITNDNNSPKTINLDDYVRVGRIYWMKKTTKNGEKDHYTRSGTDAWYYKTTAFEDLNSLPTSTEYSTLMNIAGFDNLNEEDDEPGLIGIQWPHGLYQLNDKTLVKYSGADQSCFYLPIKYEGRLRMTRLSTSNNAPIYAPALFATGNTGLVFPVINRLKNLYFNKATWQ